jgi:hypothetical protein
VNLQVELRWLKARVAALEAGQTARPARPKRTAAPRPADAIIAGRVSLWDQFVLLHPTSKLAFVLKYRLGDPSDFSRFFSSNDARGIAENSTTAERYYRALHAAIAEARARKSTSQLADFHGKLAAFQDSAARPQ